MSVNTGPSSPDELEPLVSRVESPAPPDAPLSVNALSSRKALLVPNRTIGVLQLAVICYFVTCGGSFGIEPAVGAGGATLTVVGMVGIVVLWCLPQALMSAELALLCGDNGGSIVWAERAFGGIVSFFNMFNLLFSNLCSITMSLVLFTRYFQQYLPNNLTTFELFGVFFLVKTGLLVVSSVIVLMGPKIISVMTAIIGVIIFAPFIAILVVLGVQGKLATADFSVMMAIPKFSQINFGTFISTLVWALGGFDSVGALAGEVKGGKGTYLKGVLLTIPFSYFVYIGPVLLCMVAVPDFSDPRWGGPEGGYPAIAASITIWLGVFTTVVALLAMFGQVVSGMTYVARQVWSCGATGMLPNFFQYSKMGANGVHRPIVGVITVAVGMLAVSHIPYEVLSVVFFMQRVVSLLFEYASLIRLRYLEPDAVRPLRLFWPWCWGIPTVIIGGFVLYFIRDPLIWIISGTLEGAFVVLCLVKLVYHKMTRKSIVFVRLDAVEKI